MFRFNLTFFTSLLLMTLSSLAIGGSAEIELLKQLSNAHNKSEAQIAIIEFRTKYSLSPKEAFQLIFETTPLPQIDQLPKHSLIALMEGASTEQLDRLRISESPRRVIHEASAIFFDRIIRTNLDEYLRDTRPKTKNLGKIAAVTSIGAGLLYYLLSKDLRTSAYITTSLGLASTGVWIRLYVQNKLEKARKDQEALTRLENSILMSHVWEAPPSDPKLLLELSALPILNSECSLILERLRVQHGQNKAAE